MNYSEHTRSLWKASAGPIVTGPLLEDVETDVCIVGAGIAGLLIAERLSAEGRSIVVIDAGAIAGGETSRTTAHLVTALDDRYTSLIDMHGEKGAQLAAQSHAAAIDHVEQLVTRLGIDCGWRRLDGYLTVNNRHHEKAGELIDQELEAARKSGLAVDRVEHLPRPWPGVGPALRFPNQAQVHPIRLLNGVARHLTSKGVRLFSNTRAVGITGGTSPCVRTGDTDGPTISAAQIVVATNTPINTIVSIHTKQAGYQTYVVALRVPAGSLPPALMWDGPWEDDVSYRYIRLMNAATEGAGEDLLIVGGEDHKTGQGPDGPEPFRCLEQWARANFPMCGAVERRWSGEVMEPADGVAYIGPSPTGDGNLFMVTGDSGNGITHGAIAGMLIPDQILGRGRQNPWTELYNPARKIGRHALKDYAQENLNTLAQYRDWLKRGTARSEADIEPGRGAIVTHGLKHLAIYKDKSGQCTRVSAVCPHLGGIVRWNDQEQTWDCPCHASRFDKTGKVIHGPANTNLKPETEA